MTENGVTARARLMVLVCILALALVPATAALAKKRKGKSGGANIVTITPGAATAPAGEAPGLKGTVAPDTTQTAVTAPVTPAIPNMPAKIWSDNEITTAKAECEKLLIGLTIDFTYQHPIREGACGTAMPVEVRAIGGHPRVKFNPPAVMNCRLLAKLVTWFASGVQPEARATLKSPVVAVSNASSYACRNRYNAQSGKLSEHANANALDIGSFTLENGKIIAIATAWGPNLRALVAAARQKAAAEATAKALAAAGPATAPTDATTSKTKVAPAAFLAEASTKTSGTGATAAKKERLAEAKRLGVAVPKPKTPDAIFVHALHDTACAVFGTVLGPEANQAHEDHLHVDLAARRGGAFCQ